MRISRSSIHSEAGLLVSSYGYGRRGSRLLAWLSVIGLLVAMLVSALGPEPAEAMDAGFGPVACVIDDGRVATPWFAQ